MRYILQRIATGPTMSKDLTVEDARCAMRLVLEQKVDPVQSALFLIALRMKRETRDEMQGATEAIMQGTQTLPVECEHLVTLVDPFDGYIRSLPASPFVPSVLAACGVPVVVHGIKSTGPKYGLSVNRVLNAAGIKIDHSLASAAAKLNATNAGWCYLDQLVVAPELARLQRLRDQMVKRPCITTIEKGLMPLTGRRNHLITGYVHKAYPEVYANLAITTGFNSAAFIKGIEGGVVPTVAQPSRYFDWFKDQLTKVRITPDELQIQQSDRSVALPGTELVVDDCGRPDEKSMDMLAQATVSEGLAALNGTKNMMFDCIVYGASVALASVWRCDVSAVQAEIKNAMDDGSALRSFTSDAD